MSLARRPWPRCADRRFRYFFASRAVNIAGSMMAPIALAFAVLAIEDSATALGQVLAARSIPMVVFLLLGGVIADRVGPPPGHPGVQRRSRRCPRGWPPTW